MANTQIRSIEEKKPTIYAYITPDVSTNKGWVKIGYTEQGFAKRIAQQTRTAGIQYKLLWEKDAKYTTGEYFGDKNFHWYLRQQGIEQRKYEDTDNYSEWFHFGEGNEGQAEKYFKKFIKRDYSGLQGADDGEQYELRAEQEEAVRQTLEYLNLKKKPADFLWNAKPRFGKTLASYDFVRRGGFRNVLIVTNRPAIANSWYEDFEKFIKWQEPNIFFLSESDSLKKKNALSRKEWLEILENTSSETRKDFKQIAFVSLQDLKGSIYFGGGFEKLGWIVQTKWDLLIVDEAHEGVDTSKTEWAVSRIIKDFTLHLSGTPFKAIANNKFSAKQIYNWSYADEQEAKQNWNYEKGSNPYEDLPQLNMFTYQLSAMIEEQLKEGQTIGEITYDFAFDLNEFFAVEEGKTTFKHEKDVEKWLERLTKNEKYPFSTSELRKELKHTFWLLDRVASAKAMAKLLKDDAVFSHYEIIIAAGDGKDFDEEADDTFSNEKSLAKVRKAIEENDYTITLSVGQLTTGITIPEWTAVMMLGNVQSPALYMQTAFRSQNPYVYEKGGKYYKKENAYIFDFAPDRTLRIFDDFANKLLSEDGAGEDTRSENVKRLLNFFPVIGEDEYGKMVALDARQVLTIPRKILATEVVKRGFMSNLLFANISGIFSISKDIEEILNKLPEEKEGKKNIAAPAIDLSGIEVDENGDVVVPPEIVVAKTADIFGGKVFDTSDISQTIETVVGGLSSEQHLSNDITEKIVEDAMAVARPAVIEPIKVGFELNQAQTNKVEKEVKEAISEKIKQVEIENYQKQFELRKKKAAPEEFVRLQEDFARNLQEQLSDTIKNQQIEQVEKQAKAIEEKRKNTQEDGTRGRLRGFARTIPSFLMAYGERDTKLANFEDYTPDEVFKEVTGITEEQFRKLREAGLFNEIVFDEAIQEFLDIRERLADYFDESQDEDVFNYIPPQETNQIFTPKQVVEMMVQKLEDEDPHVFEDPDRTFIDLFMKSGLYITELVKRLFNNPVMKEKIPDGDARLKHILEKQLYGLAPSDIIYQIATNYIFSFDTENKISREHFKKADTRPAVKEGKLEELLEAVFGVME